ncbi:hypothetical protein [Halocola ammonii]
MKYFYTTLIKAAALLILFICAYTAQAQLTYSPYSRFGIGNLHDQGEVVNYSMGGVTTPLANPWVVNQQNPATYSMLVGPAFQFSGRLNVLQVSSADQSQTATSGSINNISFGFPLRNDWGLAFGISPFSSTSYNLALDDNTQETGDFTRTFVGDGGISKAYLGFSKGFKFSQTKITRDSLNNPLDTITSTPHRVYFGANLNYYFGTIQNTQQVVFNDTDFLNSQINSSTSIRGPGANFGIYYSTNIFKKFKGERRVKNLTMQVGASYDIESQTSASGEYLYESFQFIGSRPITVDTANFTEFSDGSLRFPEKISAGVAFKYSVKKRAFLFAVDYQQQSWSTFETELPSINSDLLRDARQISVGFQYQPNENFTDFNLSFHELGSYRLGFRISDTYLNINGEQLTEMAVSTGLSWPLKNSRSMSKFHLGMEVGKRGSTENNLIEEEFIRAFIGFTLNPDFRNRWFRQRRYK